VDRGPLPIKYRLLLAALIVVPLLLPPLAGLGWFAYQRHAAEKRLRPCFFVSLVTPIEDPAAREAVLAKLEAAITRRLDARTKTTRRVAIEGAGCMVLLDSLTPEDEVQRLGAALAKTSSLELRLVNTEGADTLIVDQSHLLKVALTTDAGGSPAVQLRLSAEGGEKMYACTSRNLGQKLTIVHDGKILMAPIIQSAVRDEIVVTLGMQSSRKEAEELTATLDPGSRYPVPVGVTVVGK
jgi:preprotein translocase subunit SecD